MSDNVYIIRTEHEARVLYNKLAAIETIGSMIDDDEALTVTSCPAADFTALINKTNPLCIPERTVIEQHELYGKKPAPAKKSKPPKKIKYKRDNTGAVLRALNGLPEKNAWTMQEVSERSGIVAAIGEVLTRLHNTKRVHRTKDRPYKYWGMESVSTEDKVSCAARKGKVIDRDACVPNNLLDDCKTCKHAA